MWESLRVIYKGRPKRGGDWFGSYVACISVLSYTGHAPLHLVWAPLKQACGCSSDHCVAAKHSASERINSSCLQHTCVLIRDIDNVLFHRIFNFYILRQKFPLLQDRRAY